MDNIIDLYELQYSDLAALLSDQTPATILEAERLELISKSIMQNLGRDGPGLLSVSGVPKAQTLAQTLLPLARKLALLNNDDRKRVLKDHNLGSDVSLKNLDRIVSSFAMQMNYSHDHDREFNFKTKVEEESHGGSEFDDLGFAFHELGFIMMELGLSLARVCDKTIGGNELEQSLLQRGTAKGRLIHYHSVNDNVTIKSAADRRNRVAVKSENAGDSNLWQQWHYDYGIFTILTSPIFMSGECELSSSEHTFLQVFHPETKRVHKVRASKGSFILQVGESADVLSKGKLRATLHSVYRTKVNDLSRETFVVFLQPAWSKIFSLSDYPSNLMLVDREKDSGNEDGLGEKIGEVVPPLFSRLRDGMTFAEFSRETTKKYYGGSGLQSNR